MYTVMKFQLWIMHNVTLTLLRNKLKKKKTHTLELTKWAKAFWNHLSSLSSETFWKAREASGVGETKALRSLTAGTMTFMMRSFVEDEVTYSSYISEQVPKEGYWVPDKGFGVPENAHKVLKTVWRFLTRFLSFLPTEKMLGFQKGFLQLNHN